MEKESVFATASCLNTVSKASLFSDSFPLLFLLNNQLRSTLYTKTRLYMYDISLSIQIFVFISLSTCGFSSIILWNYYLNIYLHNWIYLNTFIYLYKIACVWINGILSYTLDFILSCIYCFNFLNTPSIHIASLCSCVTSAGCTWLMILFVLMDKDVITHWPSFLIILCHL